MASVTALKAKGVAFTIYEGFGQDALGIWTAPGSSNHVAWFLDPGRQQSQPDAVLTAPSRHSLSPCRPPSVNRPAK